MQTNENSNIECHPSNELLKSFYMLVMNLDTRGSSSELYLYLYFNWIFSRHKRGDSTTSLIQMKFPSPHTRNIQWQLITNDYNGELLTTIKKTNFVRLAINFHKKYRTKTLGCLCIPKPRYFKALDAMHVHVCDMQFHYNILVEKGIKPLNNTNL